MKSRIKFTGMINHYRMGMIPWAYKERFFKNLTFFKGHTAIERFEYLIRKLK
jgi:hypothetical protein